jgi:hypothetical protein
MGRLNTNDNFAFGQNFNALQASLKAKPSVQFKARMDQLRKNYELNHPLVHSAPSSQRKNTMMRASHNTNLPQVASQYSRHGKAWFS